MPLRGTCRASWAPNRVEAFIVFSKYFFYDIYKLAYRSAIERRSELNHP
jgi:hypothetical protein